MWRMFYSCETHLWSLSTARTFFHCSCDVNWTAAYGIIRAIVAELPLHSPKKPSFWNVFVKNKMVARNEYRISLLYRWTKKKKTKNNASVNIYHRILLAWKFLITEFESWFLHDLTEQLQFSQHHQPKHHKINLLLLYLHLFYLSLW